MFILIGFFCPNCGFHAKAKREPNEELDKIIINCAECHHLYSFEVSKEGYATIKFIPKLISEIEESP